MSSRTDSIACLIVVVALLRPSYIYIYSTTRRINSGTLTSLYNVGGSPVQTGGAAPGSKHPDWCVSDWVLPEEFYPQGQGGLRKRQGVPLMMYFPNLCVENAWNKLNKYTWSDTAAVSGFVLPIANQSERFWSDMFE